jgi:putative ABC transport system permease protein
LVFLLFSIRNAFRKKAVAALAVLGVAFGCALIAFLFSVAAGMERRVETTFSNLAGRIMVTQKGSVFGGLLQGVGSSAIPVSYIDIIEGVPHVYNVTGQVTAILRPVGVTMVMPLFGYGGEQGVSGGDPFQSIVEGTAPAHDDEVIIGQSLQEYLSFINVSYDIGGVYPFEVSGSKDSTRDLKVVGVYRTGNELLDGGVSGTEQLVRDIGRLQPGKLSAISAQVESMEYVETAAQEIEERLSGKKPEVQVVAPRELLLPLNNVLRVLDKFFLAVSSVAVAAGSLTILVVMLLSVVERRREFGILKALGWTPFNIVCMVLIESVVLSLLGALIGVGLGYGGLEVAKEYLAIDIGSLDLKVAVAVGACGVLAGAVGGLYPAWRANSTAPAEILRG